MGPIFSRPLTQATDSDNVSIVSGSPQVAPSPPPASAESPSDESAKPLAVSVSNSSVTSTDLPDGALSPSKVPTVPTNISRVSSAPHDGAPPPPEPCMVSTSPSSVTVTALPDGGPLSPGHDNATAPVGSSNIAGTALPDEGPKTPRIMVDPLDLIALWLSGFSQTILDLSQNESDESNIHEVEEDYKGVLATIEAATVQNLVTIVHTFAPAVSDFLKVVVAGVLAAKLNETNTFEFLMPHTDEQLREWRAKDKVEFPRVVDFTGTTFAKIREGYLAIQEEKSAELNNAASQLDVPMGAAIPSYKIFLSFLRRCRQAYSDMRYMNADMDKDDVKQLLLAKFKRATTCKQFNFTMDELKGQYNAAHNKGKHDKERTKRQEERQKKKVVAEQKTTEDEEQISSKTPTPDACGRNPNKRSNPSGGDQSTSNKRPNRN
jgi:hypothetical protein